jgi:hypothetical protein
VRGVGGVATDPTTLATAGAPGVVGVAGGVTVPPAGAAADTGVAGFSEVGFGVSGASSRQAGVVGTSDGGPGVLGGSTGGVGVVGNSGTAVGGYFSSERLAQVHLEPHRDPLGSPNGTIPGRAGDLIVLRTRRESDLVTLWFCRRSGNETTAAWVQIV